jgi:hypothetical protein
VPDQAVLLVLGFVLTTVLGGAVGYFFQKRAWKHQHDVSLRDSEKAAATKVFEELSVLMDKRLYRMRQLDWRLHPTHLPFDRQRADEAMTDYRQVLYEWNDSLNRNLALVQRYFGKPAKKELEDKIYARFTHVGALLEEEYVKSGEASFKESSRASELLEISDRIYDFNLARIGEIQLAEVGLLPKLGGRAAGWLLGRAMRRLFP